MTDSRVRSARPAITRTWVMPFGIVVGLVIGLLTGVISTAVLLDVVAWWPVWLLLLVLAAVARGRRVGALKLSGLIPLLAFVAVVFFLIAHIQGWATMPSASARLIGPEAADFERASIAVAADGRLDVAAGSEFLYEVFPIRWGGSVAVPDATEDKVGFTIAVALVPPENPGLQRFAGLTIGLHPDPVWTIDLDGEVDADLRGLMVTGVRLAGSGTVVMGRADIVEMTVSGTFTLTLPAEIPIQVVGDATVPTGWESTEDGWQSPVDGVGWVITVTTGATVEIITP